MKHLKILSGLLIAYALNSCSLFSEPEPTELPPETQTGANTFGCLINGKVFTVSYGNLWKDYAGVLGMGGENKDDLSINLGMDNVAAIGTYYYTRKANLSYSKLRGCSYGYDDIPISGKVEITKFERGEDKANNLKWLVVSGKFEGVITSRNSDCKDTIRITQGRFDVKFQ